MFILTVPILTSIFLYSTSKYKVLEIENEELKAQENLLNSSIHFESKNQISGLFISGNGNDQLSDSFIDSEGNLFICGTTTSTNLPVTPNALDDDHNGGIDIYICIISSDLRQILYLSYFGGSGNELVPKFHRVQNDIIILSGQTQSEDIPLTKDAFQTQLKIGESSRRDLFISIINYKTGEILKSTLCGGIAQEDLGCFLLNDEQQPILLGRTYSSNFPVTNSTALESIFSPSIDNLDQAYITVFDSNLTKLNYSTYLGGNRRDFIVDAYLDQDILYFICSSASHSIKLGNLTINLDRTTKYHYVFSVFNLKTLEIEAVCKFHGNLNDYKRAQIALDKQKNIYVVVETESSNISSTKNAFSKNKLGKTDLVIQKYSPNFQSLLYSSYFGGSLDDNILDLVVIDENVLLLAGMTYSSDFARNFHYLNESLKYRAGFSMGINLHSKKIFFLDNFGYDSSAAVKKILNYQDKQYLLGHSNQSEFKVKNFKFSNTINGNNGIFVIIQQTPLQHSFFNSKFLINAIHNPQNYFYFGLTVIGVLGIIVIINSFNKLWYSRKWKKNFETMSKPIKYHILEQEALLSPEKLGVYRTYIIKHLREVNWDPNSITALELTKIIVRNLNRKSLRKKRRRSNFY